MRPTRLHGGGFSLVELLIVLAMLGVLAAFLFSLFASARREARLTNCASNLQQVGVALKLYQQDWERMPTENFMDADKLLQWKSKDPLQPYTNNGTIYHCPEAQVGLAGNYVYRAALSLTEAKPYATYLSDAKTVRLLPASVLAYCEEHTTIRAPGEYGGDYIVLRADGAVKRVAGEKAVQWGYRYADSKWLSPVPFESGIQLFPVFPNEPWPPVFE